MGRRSRDEVIGSSSSSDKPPNDETPTERQDARSPKRRRKTENDGDNKRCNTDNDIQEESSPERPKSRKELRAAKKAAKKAAAVVDDVVEAAPKDVIQQPISEEELKLEKIRLRKERRVESLKERGLKERKERLERNKIRKVKKRNRELNAPGGASSGKAGRRTGGETRGTTTGGAKVKPSESEGAESSMEMKVLDNLFNGSHDDTTGMTELRLGVRFIDVVVGTGTAVVDRALVAVKYKLTGGKFGAVIDSSNRFNFRVGKGEVIQGWDIGLIGMRQGGRRQLVVPPKAGYGSQDIGAGAGATLNFDITLLECRA